MTVSQLAVSFELERYLLSVFFQSYFPGMIMVILGGLSMFLDAKSVPARVSMGKLLILANFCETLSISTHYPVWNPPWLSKLGQK